MCIRTINNFQDPVKMRSWASNFWALGADGVYVFNWYGQKFYSQTDSPELVAEKVKCLNQLGSPETLNRLDKVYQPDNGMTIFTQGMSNVPGIFPQPDLWDNEHHINPVWLIDQKPIELLVGDDLAKAARQGFIKKLNLRVDVKNMVENERISIKINGTAVPESAIKHVAKEFFNIAVAPDMFRRGINEIVFYFGRDSIGRLSSTVTGVKLIVDYK